MTFGRRKSQGTYFNAEVRLLLSDKHNAVTTRSLPRALEVKCVPEKRFSFCLVGSAQSLTRTREMKATFDPHSTQLLPTSKTNQVSCL